MVEYLDDIYEDACDLVEVGAAKPLHRVMNVVLKTAKVEELKVQISVPKNEIELSQITMIDTTG